MKDNKSSTKSDNKVTMKDLKRSHPRWCTGCGDYGSDVIRITITGDDNTPTTLDVPVGSGAF